MAPPKKLTQAEINFRKAEAVLAKAEAAHKAGKKFSDGQVEKIGQAYEAAKKAYNKEAAGVDQRYQMVSEAVDRISPVNDNELKAVYKEFGLDNKSRSSGASGGSPTPAKRTASAPVGSTTPQRTAGRTTSSPVTPSDRAGRDVMRKAESQIKQGSSYAARLEQENQKRQADIDRGLRGIDKKQQEIEGQFARLDRGVSRQSDVEELMNKTQDAVRLERMEQQSNRQQDAATRRLLESAPKAPTHVPTVAAAKPAAPQPTPGTKRSASEVGLTTPAPVKQQKVEPNPYQPQIDALKTRANNAMAHKEGLKSPGTTSEFMPKLKGAVEFLNNTYKEQGKDLGYYNKLKTRFDVLQQQGKQLDERVRAYKARPTKTEGDALKADQAAFKEKGAAFKADLAKYSEAVSNKLGEVINKYNHDVASLLKQASAQAAEQSAGSTYSTPCPRGPGGR